MSNTFFEVQAIGEIERGIPFPTRHKKPPLSAEQKQLSRLKYGESMDVALHSGTFTTDNAEQLMQWALSKGIHSVRGETHGNTVRISRVAGG